MRIVVVVLIRDCVIELPPLVGTERLARGGREGRKEGREGERERERERE